MVVSLEISLTSFISYGIMYLPARTYYRKIVKWSQKPNGRVKLPALAVTARGAVVALAARRSIAITGANVAQHTLPAENSTTVQKAATTKAAVSLSA